MQVALATLWSCFPVSASGADMLLFSLLHTSSGSCCSAETNHGLLRLCVCPPLHPHPSSCRSHFLLFFFYVPLYLCVIFCRFVSFSPVPSIPVSVPLTRSASLWSRRGSPPSSRASRMPREREEARILAKQPSREKYEKDGGPLSLLHLLSRSVWLNSLVLFPQKKLQPVVSSHTEPLPALPV